MSELRFFGVGYREFIGRVFEFGFIGDALAVDFVSGGAGFFGAGGEFWLFNGSADEKLHGVSIGFAGGLKSVSSEQAASVTAQRRRSALVAR